MGRFMANEADNYGGHGGAGFFSLKNDKDVARVRFMYNKISDIEGYAVHQIEVEGKKRYVDCKRAYNEPLDACPFCAARMPQMAKMFIPVYDVDDGSVKVWERGKKFFSELQSTLSRYTNADGSVVSQVYDIERHGKPHDTGTTYGIYPVGQPDNTTLEDLPEVPDVIGGVVMDKSIDEMNDYLRQNNSGNAGGASTDLPMRRTPARGDRF